MSISCLSDLRFFKEQLLLSVLHSILAVHHLNRLLNSNTFMGCMHAAGHKMIASVNGFFKKALSLKYIGIGDYIYTCIQ